MASYYEKIAARLGGAKELLRPALPSRFEPITKEGNPLLPMRLPPSEQQSDGEEQNEDKIVARHPSDEGSTLPRPQADRRADHHHAQSRDQQRSSNKEDVTNIQSRSDIDRRDAPQRAKLDSDTPQPHSTASPRQPDMGPTPRPNTPTVQPEASDPPSSVKPRSIPHRESSSNADRPPSVSLQPPLRPSSHERPPNPAQQRQPHRQTPSLAETLSTRHAAPPAPNLRQIPLRPAAAALKPPPPSRDSSDAARKREATAPAPIEISIGRIEIVATTTTPRPSMPVPAPRPSTPALSLEAYLSQRNGSIRP